MTASRVAREQLDRLQQGSRHVNEYIAEFQRLHTQLPSMAEDDALFAFERGLRRDLVEKLRLQGVTHLQEAIALAARVGGITAAASSLPSSANPHGRSASAHQMEVDEGNGASMEDRIARAMLNALQQSGAGGMSGMGAKTQTQRSYQQQRGGRSGAHGERGGRPGGARRAPMTLNIPGVPASVVEQRRAAGQCFRCGSGDHRSIECPNAISSSPSSF